MKVCVGGGEISSPYLNWALMLLGLEERFCTSFSCFSLRMRSASR